MQNELDGAAVLMGQSIVGPGRSAFMVRPIKVGRCPPVLPVHVQYVVILWARCISV
jgi:hypothetical protein